MHTVDIDITVPLGETVRASYQVPSNWDDLSDYQFKYIARNYLLIASGHPAFRARLFLVLLGLKPWWLKTQFLLSKAAKENVSEAAIELTEFIYSKTPDRTKRPFRRTRAGLKFLYGPQDHFDDVTLREFESADFFFLTFERSKDVKALDYFVGCLYRPLQGNASRKEKIYEIEPRVEFVPNNVDKLAKAAERITLTHKFMVYLWYKSWRFNIVKKYKVIFSGGENSHIQSSKQQSFFPLIVELSNNRISDMNKIYSLHPEDAFRYIKEALSRKKNSK